MAFLVNCNTIRVRVVKSKKPCKFPSYLIVNKICQRFKDSDLFLLRQNITLLLHLLTDRYIEFNQQNILCNLSCVYSLGMYQFKNNYFVISARSILNIFSQHYFHILNYKSHLNNKSRAWQASEKNHRMFFSLLWFVAIEIEILFRNLTHKRVKLFS